MHVSKRGHRSLPEPMMTPYTDTCVCVSRPQCAKCYHYNDVIMGAMVFQITSLPIVNSTVYSGTDQRKPQSSASLAFVRRIHRWPVNSTHKGPVTQKSFLFDDVIMGFINSLNIVLIWTIGYNIYQCYDIHHRNCDRSADSQQRYIHDAYS